MRISRTQPTDQISAPERLDLRMISGYAVSVSRRQNAELGLGEIHLIDLRGMPLAFGRRSGNGTKLVIVSGFLCRAVHGLGVSWWRNSPGAGGKSVCLFIIRPVGALLSTWIFRVGFRSPFCRPFFRARPRQIEPQISQIRADERVRIRDHLRDP